MLEKRERLRTFYIDLAHVADIKQAGARSHGQVFLSDAATLDRHLPPAELGHPSAGGFVERIECRALQCDSCRRGQASPLRQKTFSRAIKGKLAQSQQMGQGAEQTMENGPSKLDFAFSMAQNGAKK